MQRTAEGAPAASLHDKNASKIAGLPVSEHNSFVGCSAHHDSSRNRCHYAGIPACPCQQDRPQLVATPAPSLGMCMGAGHASSSCLTSALLPWGDPLVVQKLPEGMEGRQGAVAHQPCRVAALHGGSCLVALAPPALGALHRGPRADRKGHSSLLHWARAASALGADGRATLKYRSMLEGSEGLRSCRQEVRAGCNTRPGQWHATGWGGCSGSCGCLVAHAHAVLQSAGQLRPGSGTCSTGNWYPAAS